MEPFDPKASSEPDRPVAGISPARAGDRQHRAKSVGFGRFKVIDAAGAPVSDRMGKAEAEALASELNGRKEAA